MTDFNLPYMKIYSKSPSNKEGHEEDADRSMKSNVKNAEHPIFSSNGLIQTINFSRSISNTQEKPLSGKIPDKVFEDVSDICRKTKVPADFLLMMMDWKKDITSHSDGSEAKEISNKIISNLNELRSTLGRDPMHGEVFMAYVLGSASKVKTILENVQKIPEELAKNQGTEKDNIIMKKLRNGNPVPRNWRELYSFFMNRFPTGNMTYKNYLGEKNDS